MLRVYRVKTGGFEIKLIFSLLIILITLPANANYYGKASQYSGFELKTKLKEIIARGHSDRGYSALYEYYFVSDVDNYLDKDGSILDMYSEDPQTSDPYTYKVKSDRCGKYKQESDCFNREHIFPQSGFGKRSPMKSDFFHVYPTDGYVNNKRSSHPFGEVIKAKWRSANGSKLGSNSFGDYRGTVFEPIDEFKGDIARALLYFATRYEDKVLGFRQKMLNGTKDQVYQTWFIRLLLKWHAQDPVNSFEQSRNEAGYRFQKNRNPFIDHPEWVEKIWGTDGTGFKDQTQSKPIQSQNS